MEHEIICELSDYMKYVERLPRDFIVSRGQTRNFTLLPSALRKDERGNKKYSRQLANYFLTEFKVNSHNYMTTPWDIRNDYEWMVYAQHYGIPTRLLDFTYSHIVSLMFAVEDAFIASENEDSVVWFLNPNKLNTKHANRTEIITIENESSLNLDNYAGPIVVQGRKLNMRINAQNGIFVYFQDTENSLDEIIEDSDIIRKIIIKGNCRKRILKSLYSMGIGFTQIYPELESVAKDILMKNCIKEYVEEGDFENE